MSYLPDDPNDPFNIFSGITPVPEFTNEQERFEAMKTMPLQQRYAIGLKALGYEEMKPTTRYRVFHNAPGNGGKPGHYVFIGEAGAVRYNFSGKVSNTTAASQRFKDHILADLA